MEIYIISIAQMTGIVKKKQVLFMQIFKQEAKAAADSFVIMPDFIIGDVL